MECVLDLSVSDLDCLFPAYIEVDGSGEIKSIGPSLQHHIKRDIKGSKLLDEFVAVRPLKINSIDELLQHNQTTLLRCKCNAALKLRGIVLERKHGYILLLGHSPEVGDKGNRLKYRFSDFAPHDGTQDIFLASELRKGLLEDTQALVDRIKKEKIAAEAANISKSNFLACMSHEIRTPLNGVLGMASILADTGLSDAQLKMLNIISESGDALLILLNDILDLSKINAEKIVLDVTEFTLQELISGIKNIYGLKAEDLGVTFEVITKVNSPSNIYSGDKFRIRQILNNLISNALKFTDCGYVRVEISESTTTANALSVLDFSVSDTGIGIKPELISSLFSAFVQADSSISRKYGGTGLGLSISKQLCELMGGAISVKSVEGKGSTFSFSIPVKKVKQKKSNQEFSEAASLIESMPHLEKLRILVAEDNIVNQKVLVALLESLGYDAIIADNGEDAIKLACRYKFDLILMDIQMPIMDGIEAHERLRHLEQSNKIKRVPIVAVTANVMKEQTDGYLKTGFDAYLPKPIKKQDLLNLVVSLFDHCAEQQQSSSHL